MLIIITQYIILIFKINIIKTNFNIKIKKNLKYLKLL